MSVARREAPFSLIRSNRMRIVQGGRLGLAAVGLATIAAAPSPARADSRECDFTVDYRIASGPLESFWLRLRASWLDDGPARKDVTDFRVILRYELPVI